jgi:Ca-activated chloride channel family protein
MNFSHPATLIFTAIALIAVTYALRALAGRRSAETVAYSNIAFLEAATGSRIPWGTVLGVAWGFAFACMGVALAGPHIIAPVTVRDGAIALCIDTSGSMASADVRPTRAAAALSAARAFIDGVPDGTRIAVIAFSSSAAVVMPASDDKDAVRESLDRIPPPNGGTAIGDALAIAARALPAVRKRAIVLVTDGVNNAGSDPLAVAQYLGTAGITIYTVGIGTSGSGTLIPGTAEEAELDEDALRAIASSGHGAYARAADADALRAKLTDIARTSTRERRRVDASLPVAIAGGLIMIVASAGAFALGRFP